MISLDTFRTEQTPSKKQCSAKYVKKSACHLQQWRI
jgi:hypothetical protein